MRRLLADKRGIVAVEAAAVFPIFLMFAVGIFDVGAWSIQNNAVQSGVLAGGTYAMQRENVTAGQITSTVKNANPMLSNANVSATLSGGNWTISASVPYVGVAFNGIFNMPTVSASYTVPQHQSGG